MRRREFIAGLAGGGGDAIAARAQQAGWPRTYRHWDGGADIGPKPSDASKSRSLAAADWRSLATYRRHNFRLLTIGPRTEGNAALYPALVAEVIKIAIPT